MNQNMIWFDLNFWVPRRQPLVQLCRFSNGLKGFGGADEFAIVKSKICESIC